MTDLSADRIFDSFMEEMLTNQHPPDLTDQIQQRAREEFGLSARLKIRISDQSQTKAPRKQSRVHWSAIISAFAIAASLLIAVGFRQFWPAAKATLGSLQNSLQSSIEKVLPEEKPGSKNSLLARSDTVVPPTESQIVDAGAQPKDGTEKTDVLALEIEKLPFNNSAVDPKNPETPSIENKEAIAPGLAHAVPVLSNEEIVATINQRFTSLWKNSVGENSNGQSISDEEMIQRISLRLTGEDRPESIGNPAELTDKLVRSALFAEHWANQTVEYWLKGTFGADPKNAKSSALRVSIAQQIVARKPWNQVVAELIDSLPATPQSTFLVSTGGDPHQLVGRVGSKILGEAVGCARCHDSNDNALASATRQDQYWSLIGIFSGIEVKGPEKLLVDNQAKLFANGKPKEIFFNRPDGLVQTAEYKLPGGGHWQSIEGASTPRQALAGWIANSTITDRAAVNLAWRFVYGRPLVAEHSALDGIGMQERKEVLEMLAQQFEAHNRDMAQLVGWLVNSKPFATPSLDVDKQKWLMASDKDIAKWNVASANFATYAKPLNKTASKLSSLDSALASVVRWSGNSDLKRTTLAQPATAPKNSKPVASAPSDDAPAIHLVRSLHPNPTQTQFIEQIVKSKLEWPQKVEHIAGLVGDSGKNSKLQTAAAQLLKAKDGDEAAALFQILQSALLYSE